MNTQFITLKPALYIQSVHLCLAALWNIHGMQRLAAGLAAPGPVASYQVASLLIGFLFILWIGAAYYRPIYFLCTLVIIFAIVQSLYTAATGDSSLWPSPLWRWSGAALNSLAIIGGALGIYLSVTRAYSKPQ